jgi:hypothetical protein
MPPAGGVPALGLPRQDIDWERLVAIRQQLLGSMPPMPVSQQGSTARLADQDEEEFRPKRRRPAGRTTPRHTPEPVAAIN